MGEIETPQVSKTPRVEAPSLTAWLLVKKALGYGVWVGVGLSPLIGVKDVPFFSSLLDLYPESIRGWLIPVTSLIMGMIAMCVDLAAIVKNIGKRKLLRGFIRSVAVFVLSMIVLVIVYNFTVTRIEASDHTYSYLTGSLNVPHQPPGSKCQCQEGMEAQTCLPEISANPAAISACFGAQRIAIAKITLAFLYLLVMGSFVVTVGLLILYGKRVTT